MIRKLIICLICSVLLSACGKKKAEITGILEQPRSGVFLFLQELSDNDLTTVDSLLIPEDGSFEFRTKVKSPSFYLLKINQNNFLTMLIGPGEKIKMTSHFDSLNYPVLVNGSEGTELMARYNRVVLSTIRKLRQISETHDKNLGRPDFASLVDSLENAGNVHLSELNSFTKKYIDDNINSLATIVILNSQISPGVRIINPEYDLEYFSKVDSSLFSKYPENGLVISLHNMVKDMKALYENKRLNSHEGEAGAIAPDIALPTPEGDTIRLSSTRGKYVLLDFWAAWCPPCRRENPSLVRAYNTYHERGFEIYQVSLDKTREAWIKGIADDRLEKWIHVSDVKYWNSVVVPLYGIESIPASYLLDTEGRIIATNRRGDALQRKLAELFD